jgi:hypothetical protein
MRLRICETMTLMRCVETGIRCLSQRLPIAIDGKCVVAAGHREREPEGGGGGLWPGPRRTQWSVLVATKMVFGFQKRQWTDKLSNRQLLMQCSAPPWSLAVCGVSPCSSVTVCSPRQQVVALLLAHSLRCGALATVNTDTT